jgi:two-component system sensor histidine kinase ChiS
MPINVLIIDDEPLCLDMMEIMLDGTDFELVTAEGGVAGLNYINNNIPDGIDVILLDMMMPDMYGLEVLAEIKKNPTAKSIPVIIQSGLANEMELKKAVDLGAICNLRKPFKKEELLCVLERALKQGGDSL